MTTTSVDPGTTTTAAATTTTPAPACHCVYPDYCGTDEGECTYTNCASGDSPMTVDCTPTTTTSEPATTTTEDPGSTTTCDCNTTTTIGPDTNPDGGDCTTCTWFCHPVGGWVLTNSGCGGNCDLRAAYDRLRWGLRYRFDPLRCRSAASSAPAAAGLRERVYVDLRSRQRLVGIRGRLRLGLLLRAPFALVRRVRFAAFDSLPTSHDGRSG